MLLGHPILVQSDMRLECQLASSGIYCGGSDAFGSEQAVAMASAAKEWVLLWQIASDDNAGFMWGDCGNLYVMIRSDDLKRRQFQSVWVILQCA